MVIYFRQLKYRNSQTLTSTLPFIISNFLSPKSTLVVKINEGSPGRSQKLVSGGGIGAAILEEDWLSLEIFLEWLMNAVVAERVVD